VLLLHRRYDVWSCTNDRDSGWRFIRSNPVDKRRPVLEDDIDPDADDFLGSGTLIT
jgi:hypothetical protein